MTLHQKLNKINYPRIQRLQHGYASTIEEFWNSFIVNMVPQKDTVFGWHKVLMEYVKRPDAMFAIRYYNTAAKENYESLRRGFLTKTNMGYSFFYTDNFHAAYYLKMALDGYVPTVEEMLQEYNSRRFPARFGRDTSSERAMMAMPKGIDPGIQTAGYKIAHMLNVGKEYFVGGKNISLSKIIQYYFDGGSRNDWIWKTDVTGAYYIRDFQVSPEARKYLIAEFLRFVHPFNYFLTPKKTCSRSFVCSDIAEYPPLIEYVKQKYTEIYGDAYYEYLDYVMPPKRSSYCLEKTSVINIEYGFDLENGEKQIISEYPRIERKEMQAVSVSDKRTEKEIEYQMLIEYLSNPKTSFRKLERSYLGIDSQARGGGFVAKNIVNSYGVDAEMKGIFARDSIDSVIQNTFGKCRDTLIELKTKFK